MTETTYPTVEECLQIERLAHESMQAMYADLQGETARLRQELALSEMRLKLEQDGSAKTSGAYSALLFVASKFIFAVNSSDAFNLTDYFHDLEEAVQNGGPEILERVYIDQETLEAEIGAAEWADERIAELEEMIFHVWALLIVGDDWREVKGFEQVAIGVLEASLTAEEIDELNRSEGQ